MARQAQQTDLDRSSQSFTAGNVKARHRRVLLQNRQRRGIFLSTGQLGPDSRPLCCSGPPVPPVLRWSNPGQTARDARRRERSQLGRLVTGSSSLLAGPRRARSSKNGPSFAHGRTCIGQPDKKSICPSRKPTGPERLNRRPFRIQRRTGHDGDRPADHQDIPIRRPVRCWMIASIRATPCQ